MRLRARWCRLVDCDRREAVGNSNGNSFLLVNALVVHSFYAFHVPGSSVPGVLLRGWLVLLVVILLTCG